MKPKWSYRDVLVVLLVAAALAWLALRVRIGLNYQWNWAATRAFLLRAEQGRWVAGTLLNGLAVTIKLALYSLLLALPLASLIAILQSSSLTLARLVAKIFVQLIRNLPPLVLVLVFYYFFADRLYQATGLDQTLRSLSSGQQRWLSFFFYRPSLMSSFLAGVLVLAAYQAAYVSEIIRGGLLAIPQAQYYAGHSLGLSGWQIQRYVVFPQLWRKILPPLAGQFISAIKDSSIVSVISVGELSFQGNQLMTSTQAFFEASLLVFFLYFVLTGSCALLFARLFNRHATAHLR